MSRKTQTADEIRGNLFRHLGWHAAQRDDIKVAQAIHQGEELDAVFGLEEVGLMDEFWHFLKLVGIPSPRSHPDSRHRAGADPGRPVHLAVLPASAPGH